ncbi:MAG: hypothetical protein ACREVW_18710 [Burkholderiales bacterium]
MKKLLAIAAAGEAATGLALLAVSPTVVRLLFGAEIAGVGIVISRIAGISLIALGLACWPGRDAGSNTAQALYGMLMYSALVTLYLGYLGAVGEWVGILLWPAVGIHAVVTILLARGVVQRMKDADTGTPEHRH